MIVWIVRDTRTQEHYRIVVNDDNKLRFQKYDRLEHVWCTWENMTNIVNFCDIEYDELVIERHSDDNMAW